jgi:hypothetical protein
MHLVGQGWSRLAGHAWRNRQEQILPKLADKKQVP